jgi:hypothetical protein
MKRNKMLKGSAFAVTLILPVIIVMTIVLVPALVGWQTKANTRTANSAAKQLYVNTAAIIADNEYRDDGIELRAYYDADTDPRFTEEIYRRFADLERYDDWYVEVQVEPNYDYDPGTVLLTYVNDNGTEGYYPEDGVRLDDR